MAKKKHGEHHGGAWKVAYADFVTAMMALFMVLWIVSQKEDTKKQVADYFKNPFAWIMKDATGIMEKVSMPSTSKTREVSKDQQVSTSLDLVFLHALAEEFFRMLDLNQMEMKRPVDIFVTNDGLRIVMYDRPEQPFFVENSVEFTNWGKFAVQTLSWVMRRYAMNVRIDSYTPSGFPQIKPDYGSFELTGDRANAVRRLLVEYGFPAESVSRISGFGDRSPLENVEPADPSNQRVEMSLVMVKNVQEMREPWRESPEISNKLGGPSLVDKATMEKASQPSPEKGSTDTGNTPKP